MNEYYIIDLTADTRNGVLTLLGRNLKNRVSTLEHAARVPETLLNTDLERFDNGTTTRAILTSALSTLSEAVVPLRNVNAADLLNRHNNIPMIRRQAL